MFDHHPTSHARPPMRSTIPKSLVLPPKVVYYIANMCPYDWAGDLDPGSRCRVEVAVDFTVYRSR